MAQMEGTPNNLEQFFGDVEKRNRLASAWDNLPKGQPLPDTPEMRQVLLEMVVGHVRERSEGIGEKLNSGVCFLNSQVSPSNEVEGLSFSKEIRMENGGNIWFPDIDFIEEMLNEMVSVLFPNYEDGTPDFQYLGGLHGRGLLESALAQPQQTFAGKVSLFVHTRNGCCAYLAPSLRIIHSTTAISVPL